jgi:hypothetical protein
MSLCQELQTEINRLGRLKFEMYRQRCRDIHNLRVVYGEDDGFSAKIRKIESEEHALWYNIRAALVYG